MNGSDDTAQSAIALRFRQILLDLARLEDDLAVSEAAAVPHWAPPER